LKGIGLGMCLGAFLWFPIQFILDFLGPNINKLVSLALTTIIVPWAVRIWKSLDSSRNVAEVKFKLNRLARVAATGGVILAVFLMSLIPIGKNST